MRFKGLYNKKSSYWRKLDKKTIVKAMEDESGDTMAEILAIGLMEEVLRGKGRKNGANKN